MAYAVASVGGVLFFVMSVVLLAIWPGRVLEEQSRTMAPEQVLGLTASEERGRRIYSREGCAYCHTQQVRYLHADMVRFGAPTLAWETRLDYPHLWGTRRIGPDLARAGGVRSDDWHYAHLFAPRTVVSESVMPAYGWLFDGDATRPRQSARDLVAYLQSLGRARDIAGPEGEARARAGCNCPDDEMAQMAFSGPVNTSAAMPRRGGNVPELSADGDAGRGQDLYAARCASCHGVRGAGDGPAASALLPRPANLAEHEYTLARLSEALWNGVAGTAMQAWRDHSPADLAALARTVRGFQNPQEVALPANLLELGQRVFTANCVQCHGADGSGNGTAASELTIAPADLRRQRATLAHTLRIIRSGIEGTRMASWTGRLSEADIVAVAGYTRSLFVPDPPAGGLAP
jgi:cytochrome c oxidase cbb3-type subunit 2/cytochrome c oxidase cbb3-type subunit I/II